MIEIKLSENKTDKKVLINDFYDYKNIPKDELDVLIYTLEKQISEYVKDMEKKEKR